jgi:hypothetical protein
MCIGGSTIITQEGRPEGDSMDDDQSERPARCNQPRIREHLALEETRDDFAVGVLPA